MLKERMLDADGIVHLRDYLAQGGTLAKELLALPLERGHIATSVPASADPKAVIRYDTGGLIMGGGAIELIAELSARNLDRASGRYAVFEDRVAEATDQWLISSQLPYFTSRNEVYIYLTHETGDVQAVERVIRYAYTFRYLQILSHLPKVERIPLGQSVNIDLLLALAHGTDAIIIGAYDGEGFLVWTRDGLMDA